MTRGVALKKTLALVSYLLKIGESDSAILKISDAAWIR
jgi:hypothetical protein